MHEVQGMSVSFRLFNLSSSIKSLYHYRLFFTDSHEINKISDSPFSNSDFNVVTVQNHTFKVPLF